MKRLKDIKEFKIGKKYLFIYSTERTIGIHTKVNESGFPLFKVYQSTNERKYGEEVGFLHPEGFKRGKIYLLTENEFRIELL